MKTKSKENVFNYPVPYELDLFGETSVTIFEVDMWMQKVRKMDRSSPRFEWYVENWDVVGKIKRVKLEYLTIEAYFNYMDRLAACY
ncbi:hypothetical protein MCERHM31_00812 [Methylophilaceae bacterium]